jgi:hypothetical protein
MKAGNKGIPTPLCQPRRTLLQTAYVFSGEVTTGRRAEIFDWLPNRLLIRVVVGQFIEELPPVWPRVTQLKTHVAFCRACQKEVRSTHPLQLSIATGAAGTPLGPNALADWLAVLLLGLLQRGLVDRRHRAQAKGF